MFYYCEQDQAWVFTIRAIGRDDRPDSECNYGWLMQSPLTKAFNLEDVGPDGWKIWTDSVKDADLSLSCNQCFRDSDCGGRGKCNKETRKCACKPNRAGSHCQTETPFCPFVQYTVYGDSAIDYKKFGSYELVKNRDGSAVLLSNRPAFSFEDDKNRSALIFYSGTRWFYSGWDTTYLKLILDHSPTIEDIRSNNSSDVIAFHGYWYFNVTLELFDYSDPTDSNSPAGIAWNEVNVNGAIGESAPYGVAFPSKQDFLCYGNCKNESCGSSGGCGVDKNFCMCNEEVGAGGIYCEFNMDDKYVTPLVLFYYENFMEAWFNRSEYDYDAKYWSNWNNTELYTKLVANLIGRDKRLSQPTVSPTKPTTPKPIT
jgi:hypothetical protein